MREESTTHNIFYGYHVESCDFLTETYREDTYDFTADWSWDINATIKNLANYIAGNIGSASTDTWYYETGHSFLCCASGNVYIDVVEMTLYSDDHNEYNDTVSYVGQSWAPLIVRWSPFVGSVDAGNSTADFKAPNFVVALADGDVNVQAYVAVHDAKGHR